MSSTARISTPADAASSATIVVPVTFEEGVGHVADSVPATLGEHSIPRQLTAEWCARQGLKADAGSIAVLRAMNGPNVALVSVGGVAANAINSTATTNDEANGWCRGRCCRGRSCTSRCCMTGMNTGRCCCVTHSWHLKGAQSIINTRWARHRWDSMCRWQRKACIPDCMSHTARSSTTRASGSWQLQCPPSACAHVQSHQTCRRAQLGGGTDGVAGIAHAARAAVRVRRRLTVLVCAPSAHHNRNTSKPMQNVIRFTG